jgi:hypothetical protein
MKETVVLMRFLRHDPVGQRFGVGVLVMTWLAEVVRRRREENTYVADDLEDLY